MKKNFLLLFVFFFLFLLLPNICFSLYSPATAPWIFTTTKSRTHSMVWVVTSPDGNRQNIAMSSCSGSSCSIATGSTFGNPKSYTCSNFDAVTRKCNNWVGSGDCGGVQAYPYDCTAWNSGACTEWTASSCAGGFTTVFKWTCASWTGEVCNHWTPTWGTTAGCMTPYTCSSWNGDFCSEFTGTEGAGMCRPDKFECTGCEDACAGCTFGCLSDFSCAGNTPPTAPSNIYLGNASGQVGWGVVRDSWTASTDAEQAQSALIYDLDYSSNGGFTYFDITQTPAGQNYYDWNTTSLTSGSNYMLRVRAYDGYTFGAFNYSQYNFSIGGGNSSVPRQIGYSFPEQKTAFNGSLAATGFTGECNYTLLYSNASGTYVHYTANGTNVTENEIGAGFVTFNCSSADENYSIVFYINATTFAEDKTISNSTAHYNLTLSNPNVNSLNLTWSNTTTIYVYNRSDEFFLIFNNTGWASFKPPTYETDCNESNPTWTNFTVNNTPISVCLMNDTANTTLMLRWMLGNLSANTNVTAYFGRAYNVTVKTNASAYSSGETIGLYMNVSNRTEYFSGLTEKYYPNMVVNISVWYSNATLLNSTLVTTNSTGEAITFLDGYSPDAYSVTAFVNDSFGTSNGTNTFVADYGLFSVTPSSLAFSYTTGNSQILAFTIQNIGTVQANYTYCFFNSSSAIAGQMTVAPFYIGNLSVLGSAAITVTSTAGVSGTGEVICNSTNAPNATVSVNVTVTPPVVPPSGGGGGGGGGGQKFNVKIVPPTINGTVNLYESKTFQLNITNNENKALTISATTNASWVTLSFKSIVLQSKQTAILNVRLTSTQANSFSNLNVVITDSAGNQETRLVPITLSLSTERGITAASSVNLFSGNFGIWLIVAILLVVAGMFAYAQSTGIGLAVIAAGVILAVAAYLLQ